MSIPNLPIDFKDDILAATNQKRKYNLIQNNDGTVSFEDATDYQQTGSDFGARQINETNDAINKIYSERILTLEEAALVTEPGFFVDAQVITELNGKTYIKTEGTLGLATRTYTLKRYNDNTFELDGRADASLVRLQYSESTKMYFTQIHIPLPEELSVADDRYVFTAGTESGGIYFASLQNINENVMTIYISAMNYVSEISLIEIGFRLTGHWE